MSMYEDQNGEWVLDCDQGLQGCAGQQRFPTPKSFNKALSFITGNGWSKEDMGGGTWLNFCPNCQKGMSNNSAPGI